MNMSPREVGDCSLFEFRSAVEGWNEGQEDAGGFPPPMTEGELEDLMRRAGRA